MVREPLSEGTREFSVLFPMASIFFRKPLKIVCFGCKKTVFWENLLKAVCFGQSGFFLGIAGKNSRFRQNSLT